MNAKFEGAVCGAPSRNIDDCRPPTPPHDIDDWTKGFIAGMMVMALIWATIAVSLTEWGV